MPHDYPQDLAELVCKQWPPSSGRGRSCDSLPSQGALGALLGACYHASFLLEEQRPVAFRLIVREPELFAHDQGPPNGLQPLSFTEPRPLSEHELRRLAPAARFQRALIGAHFENGRWQLWGIVVSGPRWLQVDRGGRRAIRPLPPAPVVLVTGPGRMAVHCGSELVGLLRHGHVGGEVGDLFSSAWLPELFSGIREELLHQHDEARASAPGPWSSIDPEVIRRLGQQFVKRIIAALRDMHHGGMIVFLPSCDAGGVVDDGRYVLFKYRFTDAEPRRRMRWLLGRILATLAEICGGDGADAADWGRFEASPDARLSKLDDALFETAHFLADLAAVDGAVVITQRFELLGFGAEVSGETPRGLLVARALDDEATRVTFESAEGMGTRHRAAFRLCNSVHDALAIVVSQDDTVRFVRWHNGAVTYWDYSTFGL
jgi:DisA bacterial checkpoint controller nucleotide-binding